MLRIKKKLRKVWKHVSKCRSHAARHGSEHEPGSVNVQHEPACEHQEEAEPHLTGLPVGPQHVGTEQEEARGDSDLQLQLSKMAAREAQLLRRLEKAEGALARQLDQQTQDQLSLSRLEEENARMVAEVEQKRDELNRQVQEWKDQFHLLKSLNIVLLHEREKAWELERAALETKIACLEGSQKTPKNLKNWKICFRNTAEKYWNMI